MLSSCCRPRRNHQVLADEVLAMLEQRHHQSEQAVNQ
jgi:hypothetical protein